MNRYMQKAEEIRKAINKFAENQTDETLIDNKSAFRLWSGNGLEVKAGEIYLYNDALYRVVQNHTTQNDWTPDKTPALYTKISVEEFPEWKQPQGAHDAYEIGKKYLTMVNIGLILMTIIYMNLAFTGGKRSTSK